MADKKIFALFGPNLNLTGIRQPEFYGTITLQSVEDDILCLLKSKNIGFESFQSNHEGILIDTIHTLSKNAENTVIIINPGALAHYSYSLCDAISAVKIPFIELHFSNIFARESFRQHSVIAPYVKGMIAGFGIFGYKLAVYTAIQLLEQTEKIEAIISK